MFYKHLIGKLALQVSSAIVLYSTGKVAQKDDQMIAQGRISIVYELNRLVPVLRRHCFTSGVGM